MEESNGIDDNQNSRDAELPLKDMRNWQLIPSANESPVKSTTVVKYSAVQRAASFTELQCNTDLNLPPSNWLTSSAESYGLQHVPTQSTGFSSFRLAHMFPDCVGQVDVVSDAENIKKLLKIPYSRGAVSMMVHRVDNTLLIDDFDFHKLLLHQSRSDWEWLREFLLTHVRQSMSCKDKGLVLSHRRSARQNRHLVSKFLHHSLATTDPPPPPPPPPLLEPSSRLPLSTKEPPLPEPQITEELPDSRQHKFLRNVVWNFEDLQMLLGTDMPIFGGPTHPCISLRLCDMAKPISVLTGIDYWLDNLMSNVPEVVMCFHLDGIVKRYELVKTEDLPYLEDLDHKFSPKVVRDVAQNILSFLKNNAAKAGHTYWLFKGKDDDVVKLYDLTSLCSDSVDEKGQNPFTVPVAMLLYQVARNLKHSVEGQHKRSTIAVLLDNCVRLLDAQKYPQIATSAHFMLSDLYIPATIDPAKPVFDDELDDEEKEEGNQNLTNISDANSLHKSKKVQKDSKCSVKKTGHRVLSSDSDSEEIREVDLNRYIDIEDPNCFEEDGVSMKSKKKINRTPLTNVMSLNLLENEAGLLNETDDEFLKFTKPPPLVASVPERCVLALKHIANGLKCLQYFGQEKELNCKENKPEEEEEAPQMAKPFEPIPMPYTPLNKSDKQEDKDEKHPKGKKLKQKSAKNSCNDDKNDKTAVPEGLKQLLCPMPYGGMPSWQAPDKNDHASWNYHLKILLYEKAVLVYATLAEHAYSEERYGRALQMIGRVLRCRQTLECLLRISNPNQTKRWGLESYLLGRAGDCCFMLVQFWVHINSHRSDLASNTSVDAEIEHEMFRDCSELDNVELNLIPEKLETMEQLLKASLACYEGGLSLSPDLLNFNRRIGNVQNELGCLYMSQAHKKYEEINKKMNLTHEKMDPHVKQSFMAKFDLSLQHLESGLRSFEVVNDRANLALLHSNIGRLLRLLGHFHVPSGTDPKEHFLHERSYYSRSLASYETALEYLGQRKGHEEIWDAVTWELSTALYNMGIATLEHPSPHLQTQGKAAQEKVALDYLNRTLKHCDTDNPGPKQLLYQFRAASIHHKLAAIYHRQFREIHTKDDKDRKPDKEERHARAVLQSCHVHYQKARELFLSLERPLEYFNCHLECIALEEFIAENCTNPVAQLKATVNALELIYSSIPVLKVIATRDSRKGSGDAYTQPEESSTLPEEKKELDLLLLYERRLQMNLLIATKSCSKCTKKDLAALEATFKSVYLLTMRTGKLPDDTKEALMSLSKHLISVIAKVETMWKCKVKKAL